LSNQQIAKLFDANQLAAVEFLAAEDTDAVLAIWLRMLTLAANDPEGCVRLAPGLHMEPAELANYFHCTAEALEVTIQILEQLQQLTRNPDGTLKLTACAGLCRRSKSKKPVAETTAANSGITSGTNDRTVCDATEKETEKEKRKEAKEKSKEKKKKADIAAAMFSAREPAEADAKAETQPGAAAAETATQQSKRKNNRLIPTPELPEPVPTILNAWNSLPLDNKFDGLYPAMLKQVQGLLERYGEEALLKAIDNVAHSNFLLGNTRNNRGWTISFGWLLNPEHLENILQGKYQNKKPRGGSLLFQPGDEQEPYSNGFYGTVVN
jgi:hypothetical protein